MLQLAIDCGQSFPKALLFVSDCEEGLKDASIVTFSADFGNASLIKNPLGRFFTIVLLMDADCWKSFSQIQQDIFILMATITQEMIR